MNVLVLHSELGVLRGGGENFTRNLFTAFAARGHRVAAAFAANRTGFYPLPLPPNLGPIPIPGWWSMNFGQATLSAMSRRFGITPRLRAACDRVQEAIAWRTIRWHFHRFQQRAMMMFAREWGNYDVVYVHGHAQLASEVARYRPAILRLPGPVSPALAPVLRSIPAVCANGDALTRLRGILGDAAVELPVGLDCQRFLPAVDSLRSSLGWTGKHLVIGYVGRLVHLKGVLLLATAFREVVRRVPLARLLLIGRGEDEKSLRTLLANEVACGYVHFEPDVDHEQLPRWYHAMDLFVMPSRYENFSNAVLEALACGVPVLASNVGGNTMLNESEAGWLFDAQSSEHLCEMLCQIALLTQEQRERGKRGVAYVRQRFSWEASAQCLERIITEQLGVSGLAQPRL